MTYDQAHAIITSYDGNREALARYLSTLGCGRVAFCRALILRILSKVERRTA